MIARAIREGFPKEKTSDQALQGEQLQVRNELGTRTVCDVYPGTVSSSI